MFPFVKKLEDTMRRWKDWLRQAERKLQSASWALKGKFYEDACFMAQQAAELAAKSLMERKGENARGHSAFAMLNRITANSEVINQAKALDQYYIPTRYPNGFESGAPMDYYTKQQAEEAISYAENIIKFVKAELKKI